jgi:hypothetical protein
MPLFVSECMKKRKLPILTKSDFYENFCERLLVRKFDLSVD